MRLFRPRSKEPAPRKLRVLAFTSPDWGFTDASIPKLRLLVAKLEEEQADLQLWHSSLTARFFGDDCEDAFARAKVLLEEARQDPDFSGFLLGSSEGLSAYEFEVMRICGEALQNARKS